MGTMKKFYLKPLSAFHPLSSAFIKSPNRGLEKIKVSSLSDYVKYYKSKIVGFKPDYYFCE